MIAAQLSTALEGAAVQANDSMYTPFVSFLAALNTVYTSMDQQTEEEITASLDTAFATLSTELGDAMLGQYNNEKVADDTVVRLMEIFGIAESDLPAEARPKKDVNGEDGDYEPDDEDKALSSGGLGSGEMIYGSNDVIYDPELGEYVSYGEVINRYYAKISELIVDGTLSEEDEAMISNYFAILFNGSANKK